VCKSTGCIRACAAALHRVVPGAPLRWLRARADTCIRIGRRLATGSQYLLATACAAALPRFVADSPFRWLRGCADACVALGWRLVAGSQYLLATAAACSWRHAAYLAASACGQRASMFSEDAQPSRRPCLLSRSKRGRNLLRRAPRGAGLCRVAAARRGVQLAPWSAVRARQRARAWSQGGLGQCWVRIRRWIDACDRYSEKPTTESYHTTAMETRPQFLSFPQFVRTCSIFEFSCV
jgi:hypothetical protein